MVKLDIDGFIFEFRVDNYRKSSEKHWYEEWCTVHARLYSSDQVINYKSYSETMLCCEVETLYENLSELINGTMKENKYVALIEPDFEYTCVPGINNRFSLEWVFCLWSDHTLTGNSIHTWLGADDVKELHEYLEGVIEDD